MSNRRPIMIVFLIAVGLVAGLLIKNMKFGLIIGILLGLFSGTLIRNSK
jgi:preprotein translocase subunit SecF